MSRIFNSKIWFLRKNMKVHHVTNLHKNILAESHKYKIKHFLLEIKSLKVNLIKSKACQSVISQIQHLWCNQYHSLSAMYVGGSKIFQTGAVKIIKLTISPIGRHDPRSSSLPHVETGPTVSSIFGTHPGSSFLWECQALSAFRPGCPQWYRTGVLSASISF